jgi:hypothetical protein
MKRRGAGDSVRRQPAVLPLSSGATWLLNFTGIQTHVRAAELSLPQLLSDAALR